MRADLDIVEPDDRYVVRNVQAQRLCGGDTAERLQVRHHEQRGRAHRLPEHLLAKGDGLAAAVAAEPYPSFIDLEVCFHHRLAIPFKPLAAGCEAELVGEGVADISDLAMPELDQMTGGNIASMDVIGADERNRPANATERHGGNVGVAEKRRLTVGDL